MATVEPTHGRRHYIFINYRRQDSAGYTGRLYDALVARFGRDAVFMDIDAIAPGVDFLEALHQALSECDVLVAVLGPTWLGAVDKAGRRRIDQAEDYVRVELELALQRGIRVLPVLVADAKMPEIDELPAGLAGLSRRNAFELSDRRWRTDVEMLCEVLERICSGSVSGSDALPAREKVDEDRARDSPKAPEPLGMVTHASAIGEAEPRSREDMTLPTPVLQSGGQSPLRDASASSAAIINEHGEGVVPSTESSSRFGITVATTDGVEHDLDVEVDMHAAVAELVHQLDGLLRRSDHARYRDIYCERLDGWLDNAAPVGSIGLRNGDRFVLAASRLPAIGTPRPAPVPVIELVITEGPEAGRTFRLTNGEYCIGRDQPSDLLIADSTVSSAHLTLTVGHDSVVITDLGSTNGTYVVGERLDGARSVLPGELVELGATAFEYHVIGA